MTAHGDIHISKLLVAGSFGFDADPPEEVTRRSYCHSGEKENKRCTDSSRNESMVRTQWESDSLRVAIVSYSRVDTVLDGAEDRY